MKRGFAIPVVLLLLAAAPAVCQSGRRRQSTTRSNTDQSTSDKAMPNFAGIVRGLDKKMLLLEQADQNTMQLYCTKKTQYFDGANKIKAKQIQTGDRVSVEARLGPDGKPEAVNVRLEHEKPAPETGSPQ
ncbi:MAG: hypothetical protein ABSH46_00165 [Bryobacteraceae bacterium]|jgi:phage terminase small subunit